MSRQAYNVYSLKDKILRVIPYDQDADRTWCTNRWLERKLSTFRHPVMFHQALHELEEEGKIKITDSSYVHGYPGSQGRWTLLIEVLWIPIADKKILGIPRRGKS